jgi:hypothetical protein
MQCTFRPGKNLNSSLFAKGYLQGVLSLSDVSIIHSTKRAMKILALWTCVFSTLVLLAGCASSPQNQPQQAEADTMPTHQPIPASPLGPGSARVSATVVAYQEEQDAYVCTLKIKQVHQYGASTPPLPTGTEIAVLMHQRLFGDDPDGHNAAERLQANQAIEVTLKHQPVPEGGTMPRWRALELH